MIKRYLDPKTKAQQILRIRRLGMASLTYTVPISVVALIWLFGMIPAKVFFYFTAYSVLINLLFLSLFLTGFNLKFQEPSLTAIQMAAPIIPALWVMYFLEDGQARSALVLIIVAPLLYGILVLNTRQFIKMAFLYLSMYLIFMLILWGEKPEILVGPLELIQTIAFVLVLVNSAIIGGFISGLREKVRNNNKELKAALAKIEEIASVDSLTGVYNRRRLYEILTQEINRYQRGRGPFSVCMLDIDRFKQINDMHGHPAGDEILCRIASHISRSLRNIDCFGRFGGEEFLMILPQTSLEGATVKAEKVRQQVESLHFRKISENLQVTISIGVAEYQVTEDINDTISRADKCLYEAKNNGRNRVVTERDNRSPLPETDHSVPALS